MPDIERGASAVWQGTLREGTGTISTQSGTLKNTPYTFVTRFEDAPGTNPEELLAAAEAACFTMALGSSLGRAGHTVHDISTQVTTVLGLVDGKRVITQFRLVTRGKVEGIDQATFAQFAEDTKKGCIVSQALSAVPMVVEAHLEQ